MDKQKSYQGKRGTIQIGISSLLLVFTVLCLVVFCVLALSSARVDWNLTQKNKNYIMQYYEADSLGEETAQKINEFLIDWVASESTNIKNHEYLKKSFQEKFDALYDIENNTVSYQIDLNNDQFISICLKMKPDNEIQKGMKNYEVISWVVQNKMNYEIDESVPVWNGKE